jgi:hypothetical protein
MATILEILKVIENHSVTHNAEVIARLEAIIASNRDAYNCLQARIETLSKAVGCNDFADVIFAVDSANTIAAGDFLSVNEWLEESLAVLSPDPDGVNAAIYSSPRTPSDGTTLNNTNENHNLTSSGVALGVAASNLGQEGVGSDGRQPFDQLINSASTELIANGRTDSRKIIVLFMSNASNFVNGYGTVATSAVNAADNARANGYELYVVSVGAGVDQAEAAAIAGDTSRLFHVDNYESLIYTVDNIKSAVCDGGDTYVDCIPTDPTMEKLTELDICDTGGCCDDL